MSPDTGRFLCIAALLAACLLAAWAAWACQRGQRRGLPGPDALIWAGLAGVLLLLSQVKLGAGLGLVEGRGRVAACARKADRLVRYVRTPSASRNRSSR
jgi:hypothetical protein